MGVARMVSTEIHYVSPPECLAMRFLALTGWTHDEIAFVLERSTKTVRRHVKGVCIEHSDPQERQVETIGPVWPERTQLWEYIPETGREVGDGE